MAPSVNVCVNISEACSSVAARTMCLNYLQSPREHVNYCIDYFCNLIQFQGYLHLRCELIDLKYMYFGLL